MTSTAAPARSCGRWGASISFKLGSGTSTAFQHAAVLQPDGTMTIFDDGAGPPTLHNHARDPRAARHHAHDRRARRRVRRSPQISAQFEGNVQLRAATCSWAGPAALLLGGQLGRPADLRRRLHGPDREATAHTGPPGTPSRRRSPGWRCRPARRLDDPIRELERGEPTCRVAGARGPAPRASATSGTSTAAVRDPDHRSQRVALWAVQAIEGSGRVLGTSAVSSTPAHLALTGARCSCPVRAPAACPRAASPMTRAASPRRSQPPHRDRQHGEGRRSAPQRHAALLHAHVDGALTAGARPRAATGRPVTAATRRVPRPARACRWSRSRPSRYGPKRGNGLRRAFPCDSSA